ncbi:hypothetical protein [Streptomyces sp. NPDC058335]|uniref:hypothetical protein n=1 Tax=Streptomyces sp. NPDC058335 TaxID=3346451 RepID=UPI00365327F9
MLPPHITQKYLRANLNGAKGIASHSTGAQHYGNSYIYISGHRHALEREDPTPRNRPHQAPHGWCSPVEPLGWPPVTPVGADPLALPAGRVLTLLPPAAWRLMGRRGWPVDRFQGAGATTDADYLAVERAEICRGWSRHWVVVWLWFLS